MSRIITIFLASSDELIHDRNSFHSFIATLDDIYEPRGIRIKLKRWEDFAAHCTDTRTQDDYNKIVRQSDMCIAMFHRKGGIFTIEEFRQALDEYNINKTRPKTYVYIRALADGEFEEIELAKFKEELFKQIGHYWCNYSTEDAMKLHFVMQFERYVLPNDVFKASEEKILKVKNGVVTLFDRVVARYENLPFASDNEQYKQLKGDIANANKEIAALRSINNSALESIILSKVVERNKKQEQLDELERDLFNQALYIAQIMSHDKPISERKRRAIELFQEGKNREAAAVLNEDEIAADCQRAGEDMERGRLLMQAGEKMIENAKEKIRSLIEEYIMRAKSLMADQDNPNRLQQACWVYKKAIDEATHYLDEKESVVHLFNYAYFLQEERQYNLALESYTRALNIYRSLSKVNPEAYLPDVAMTLNNLAVLQSDLHQYDKAEENYTEALRNSRDLAKVNPEAYLPDVAGTLNNLANLQSDLHQYDKAEENYTEALRISRDLAKVNPEAYRMHYAIVLGCMSYMYILKREFVKAELCACDGIKVDSTQTFIYSNLASSLLMQGKYGEAEKLYLLYKNELRDAFLDDFRDFEEIGIIPEEYREDVEKIKRILNE